MKKLLVFTVSVAAVAMVAMAACSDPADVAATGITIDKPTLTFVEGTTETQTLTAILLPQNAIKQAVMWSSDNREVAKVNSTTGEVSAVAYGTANITATTRDGQHKATCKVFVNIEGTVGASPEPIITWTISDGTLTFSGKGQTPNYEYSDETPWDTHMEKFDTVVFEEGITLIGGSLFYEHTGLRSVSLPESLVGIFSNVFFGCTALTEIELPSGLQMLGGSAFGNCTALESIAIPDGVTIIPSNFFRGCTSLANVTLPADLEEIEDNAFADCAALTSLVIPVGVERIKTRAFNGCTALANVTVLAVEPPALLQDAAPSFNAEGDTLHVPASTVEAYREDAVWSAAFDEIVAI